MYKVIFFDFFGVVHDGRTIDKGVLALIKDLQGRYQIGLLSNSNRGFLRPLLEQEGVADLFDAVIVSGEVGVSKPHPDIFTHALKQMKIAAKEVVFIDDSPANIAAASSTGMRSILFTGEPLLREDLKQLNIL